MGWKFALAGVLVCGSTGMARADDYQVNPAARLPNAQRLSNCESPDNYQKMVELAQQMNEPKPAYEDLVRWCKANTAR